MVRAVLRRENNIGGGADHFLFGVAELPLGTDVPACDDASRIDRENGKIRSALDNELEQLRLAW
jgi:hypothetical protein